MTRDPLDIRVDAREKLIADTLYIRDMKFPDMWFGVTIRSPHAHAKITGIEFDPEFDWQQVTKVTARDVPVNYVAMLEKDMPFLASDIVRYVGEPVILLAAPNKKLLAEAAEKVHVSYEPLPAIFNMLEAEDHAVKIFNENNVFKKILISKGDPQQALQNADTAVSIETTTGYQEHLYLEPQGIVAVPFDNRIEIHGSLQCPYYVKNALVTMFDNTRHITVIQSPTGGAFGGKEDYPSLLAGHAALLADRSGHPVAIFYDRLEDVRFTTKRHPSHCRATAYVRNDGTITGIDMQIHLDGGAYCTLSQVVLARTALAALGCYFVPDVRIDAKAVATNTVPNGAFRGFGGPQAIFAIEMLIEKIAARLNLRPDEIRRRNLIKEGQETATGQVLKYSVSAHETFEQTIKQSNYAVKYAQYEEQNEAILAKLRKGEYPRNNKDDVLKGIGVCAFLHGAGFTGTGENKIKGKVIVRVEEDGKINILSASTEMGQGEQTAMRSILAKALQTDRNQIRLAEVNTDLVPDSGPTVASRTTMIVGSLLVEAGKDIIDRILKNLDKENSHEFSYQDGFFSANGHRISFADAVRKISGYEVEKQYRHPPIIRFDDINWQGDAYPVFSWAAAVAEISVDPVTFEITVDRYTTSHDIGKAINYDQAVAQIQGGSLQGIGYALYEKAELKNGLIDISGFTDYIIPTAAETPEFDIHIMENPYPYGPFGAKGLGELPLVGAAPAVVSALNMIFKYNFYGIPVMPEQLAELFEKNHKEAPDYAG